MLIGANQMYMFSKKGHIPPLTAFEAATKDHREAFGMAAVVDNDIVHQVGALPWEDDKKQVADLHAMAESYKDNTCLYWFSDSVVPTEQPFIIFEAEVEGKTSIQAVIALAGDYEKHEDENVPESPEKICFDNLLKPRLDEIATKVKFEPDGIQSYLQDKDQATAFLDGATSETSDICLMFASGGDEGKGFLMNFEGSESPCKHFSWGYMSDPLGYTEDKAGATTKGGKISLAPKKNITAEMDKAIGTKTLISIHPPKSVKSSKDLVTWYQTWNEAKDSKGKGIVPENMTKRPPIDVDKAKWEAEPFQKGVKGTTATSVPPTAGTTSTKIATATQKTGVHHVTFNPTLSAADKAELTGGWLREGFINDATTATKSLADAEYKVPTFVEVTGISANDLLRHTPTSLNYLVRKHETLATNLIVELLRLCAQKGVLTVKSPTDKPATKIQLKGKAA
jgi:hypothetical protein